MIELPLVFRVGSRYGNYVKMGAVFTILFVVPIGILLLYVISGWVSCRIFNAEKLLEKH